uniref:Uncharacterized protein n=1 Tax=Arundo donax TaxID=35708 RepID=A0A0A9BRH3_ARUDO
MDTTWWIDYAEHKYFFACLGAFLLDAGDLTSSNPIMSDFRVLCVRLVQVDYTQGITTQARVFSARDNYWLWSVNTDVDYLYDSVLGLDMYKLFSSGPPTGAMTYSSSTRAPVSSRLSCCQRSMTTKTTGRTTSGSSAGGEGAVHLVRVVGDSLEVISWAHGSGECLVERKLGLSQMAGIDVRPDRSLEFLGHECGGRRRTRRHITLLQRHVLPGR